ncbi:MAG: hypothetical protein E7310_08505 [Clostridiales bacterium]|nr:hypothetical protein [Clostridiales bacterium]
MYKKISILLTILFIFLFFMSVSTFAVDNVKNTVNSGVNTVADGVDRLGSDVRNGIGAVENGIENMASDAMGDTNDENKTNKNTTADSNYTASRISADATAATSNAASSTLWIWVAVAIAAIVIIGLVWYYASQENTINTHRH